MPSLKPLKSVAHNVCHQFASTLNYWEDDYGINHLARAVVGAGDLVMIDLLTGTSRPPMSGNGAHAVQQLSQALPVLLAKEGVAAGLIASATAIYEFRSASPERGASVRYGCRVELTTTEGHVYAVAFSEGSTA